MPDDRMQHSKEPWFVRLADFIATRRFRAVLWCLLLLVLGPLPGSCVWDIWESRHERDRLLHHTDHQALLKACRDLMVNHPEVTMGDVENDPGIPEIIRHLGVSYITIKRDHVHIELHGGFDHYGVYAFPEGSEHEGGTKLIDGLWYYSGG